MTTEATDARTVELVEVEVYTIAESGEPVPGVEVRFENQGYTSGLTDQNGYWRVRLLPGTCIVTSQFAQGEFTPAYTQEIVTDTTVVLLQGETPVMTERIRPFADASVDFITLDRQGNPVGGITVTVVGPSRRSGTTSDATGRCSIRLVSGYYYITSGLFARVCYRNLGDGMTVKIQKGQVCTIA